MAQFHNPYHFVPVKPKAGRFRQQPESDAHVRHDAYVAGTYSGTIRCQLTTKTPVLNGGTQTEGDKQTRRRVFSYRSGTEMAASSLRGMIGSLIEAASNSALRVLDTERPHSFRKPASGQALSAIGMVVELKGQLVVIPFCPPTISRRAMGDGGTWTLEEKWKTVFPGAAGFKVYLGDSHSIRNVPPAWMTWFQTYLHGEAAVYGMRLNRRAFQNGAVPDDSDMKVKDPGSQEFLIGQLTTDDAKVPQPWREIAALPDDQRAEYVPGLIRVLGCAGRADMPNTKKHELFLPLPPKLEANADGTLQFTGGFKRLEIPPSVLRRFYDLADERTAEDKTLPYEPQPTRPGRKELRLETGDLIYFDVTRDGKAVRELSFSSIWRGRADELDANGLPAKAGNTGNFFRALGDPDLLPMSPERTPERAVVTIAERMLGYVEDVPKGADLGRQGRALASRLRFTDAKLAAGQTVETWYKNGELVPLRVLDSPKPPSPSFYFENGGKPIAKPDLQVGTQRPQGRKMYLHPHRGAGSEPEPFRSKLTPAQVQQRPGGYKQYSEAQLLNSGLVYDFAVRFDNLSRTELGLLVYALTPADGDAFWHKFGMGKAIGLGSVKIEVAGIDLVNRAARYTVEGFSRGRYEGGGDAEVTVAALRKEARERMDPDIRKAVELIGDPGKVKFPVHVPSVRGAYPELETFKWFVENDRSKPKEKQQLRPIRANTTELPTLKTWEEL